MSTRGHVLLNNEAEIYEETNEGKYIFGHLRGWNVYAIFKMDIVTLFKMDNDHLYLHLKEDSETAKEILPEMRFWANDVISFEIECNDLTIVFKGDGLYTRAWGTKFFRAFSPLYKYDYNDFKIK